MHIASLHLHPLKSAAVVDVVALTVSARGPTGDRRWLAVDSAGGFLTAREHPLLVRIHAQDTDGALHLSAPGMDALRVPQPSGIARRTVRIWGDVVDAACAGAMATDWVSRYLGFPAHLVHMDDAARRPIDPAFGRDGDEVSFSDGYPLLVISQTALDGLNARLSRPVPMARFRPNIVIGNSAAHEEDQWREVRIGGVVFDAVKACTRCVFTTLDPVSGARDPDGEPLATLKTYRRTSEGITFGMNLIPRGTVQLRIGDAVEVIARR